MAICVAVTHVYAASSEFGIYSDVTYVQPWDWWILQSVMRFEEVASCCLILLIAFRNPFGENSKIVKWMTKCINRQTAPMTSVDSRTKHLTVNTITSHVDSQERGLKEK